MSSIYQFESESSKDQQNIALSNIINSHGDNEKLRRELTHFAASVVDLIAGSQKHKINNRGFVFLVSGTWGAGKTSATWALTNEIRAGLTSSVNSILVIEKPLLPFGSTDESIVSFLSEFAEMLWSENLIDIRSEIKRFILEVTPDSEAKYNISATLGPINLSRTVNNTDNFNADKLRKKFSKLTRLNTTALVILDDLDRLRPSEIVDIMRMVEKLRALPNVIVILPIFKQVVTGAFESDLHLPPASAATFLRKLTDAELFIENDIAALKQIFLDSFDEETISHFENSLESDYKVSVADLCWAILLHNLIIEEMLVEIEGSKPDGMMPTPFDTRKSQYLRKFRQLLVDSKMKEAPNPYPVYHKDGTRELFVSLGDYYGYFLNSDDSLIAANLRSLLNYDEINRAITQNPEVVQMVADRTLVSFDPQIEAKSSSPMFMEVLLPLLLATKDEIYLSSNYRFRDMKILVRMIMGDPDFEPSSDPVRSLYKVVQDSYRRFRF